MTVSDHLRIFIPAEHSVIHYAKQKKIAVLQEEGKKKERELCFL